MTDHIAITRDGAVQIMRMNRPDKKNALTRAMYAAMAKALHEGDQDPDVRCHVLLGVPGAFTSGNDISDFLSIATGAAKGTEVMDFLLALAGMEKPLVAGVDGVAIGIGTTLQFHCDRTLATPRSLFKTPFINLGLVPEAGSSLLAPRAMGHQAAFALLVLGEDFAPQKALSTGLIHEVVAEEALERKTLETASMIAAKPFEALTIARNLMLGDRKSISDRIREESVLFYKQLHSQEAREAFVAFMARKKPA